jgi:hypothetical protein
MSTFALVTDDEEPRDLGDLARAIQWAELVVNTALPPKGGMTLEGTPSLEAADRAAFRAVAFAGVLRATTEHRYTARPAVLEALMDGRMPPVEESS